MNKTDVPSPLINWPELLRLSSHNMMPERKPEEGDMWENAAIIQQDGSHGA